MPESIAVLGATGRTGGSTVRHLRKRGVDVTAFTRDAASEAAKALRELGCGVVAANMESESMLQQGFEGVNRLFNVQPAYDNRGRYQGELELSQAAAVARAAGAAGVSHIVQLSAGRGELTGISHFDSKLTIRQGFEDQGLTVTALHPAPFMELMVDPSFAPALSVWGVEPRIVGWDRPVPWVAVDDIGRSAADALTGPIPNAGETIELIGDVRSLRECRRLLTEAGRRPRRVPIPTWLFRSMVGDELIQMWRWVTECDEFTITPGLLGIPGWVDRIEA